MSDLTLLRSLRDEDTVLDAATADRAYARTAASIATAEARGRQLRQPHTRRLVWAGGITAGAVALTIALTLTDTIGVAGLRPGATAAAAELLDRAAGLAIRSTDPTLVPGQFRQVVFTSVHALDGNGETFSIHEDRTTWIPANEQDTWTEVRFPIRSAGQYWTPNAKRNAEQEDATNRGQAPEVLHGKAGAFFGATDPARTFEGVNGLPQDPRVLLNHIYRVTLGTGPSPDGEALVFIADTLNTGLADAATRAALYRAAALIPGVTLTAGSATLDGHQGVAIGRVEGSTGIRQDLIIDPQTGGLIGEREVATRHLDPFPAGATISWSSADTTIVDQVPAQYR